MKKYIYLGLVAVIIAATLVVLGIKAKKIANNPTNPVATRTGVVVEPLVAKNEIVAAEDNLIYSGVDEGTIAKIENKQIFLAGNTEVRQIQLTDKTYIYKMNSGQPEKKTTADLQAGLKIQFEYNKANQDALAISLE